MSASTSTNTLSPQSLIQFADDFTEHTDDYLLIELPSELQAVLTHKGELEAQEFKGDSFIVGDEHLYQLVRLQVSNLMLVGQLKTEAVSNKEKVVVRSFQQSTLIPTPVRPFSQDLLQHLRQHAVDAAAPEHRQAEMAVGYLKQRFLTNAKALNSVLRSLGAQIVDGYVVLLKESFKANLLRTVIENARDKDLLHDKDSTISLQTLGVPTHEQALVKVVLESYFDRSSEGDFENQTYRIRLKSLAEVLLIAVKKDTHVQLNPNYEELLDLLIQDIHMTLPRKLVDSFGTEAIQLAAESAIRRCYLISDNQDFNLPIHNYAARNIKATPIDFESLSDTPLERLQTVSNHVTSFTRAELDDLFEQLFVVKAEYENFLKKYFKRISRFVAKSMMDKYGKLFPSHVAGDLVKPNEIRKDTFEVKVYKVNKTWATK